jgi:hypothetical protein
MKIINYTVATALSLGSALSASAETEQIEKGPYTITIDSEGEFGSPDYKYNFLITMGNRILLQKESESSIRGWALNERSIIYDKGKDILWVIYEQTQDGLDEKEINLAKISQGKIEEISASYNPLERAPSLELKEVPSGWNKEEALKILQQSIGGPISEETVLSTGDGENPQPNEVGEPPTSVKESPTQMNGKENKTERTPNAKKEHSMEW